jgi:murein L,D-transpeptidase YcbB/YkuD
MSCNNKQKSILKHKSISTFYLDSLQLETFIKGDTSNEKFKQNLQLFYGQRNYEFAWIGVDGLNEYAYNFINLMNQEDIKKDSLFSYTKLQILYHIVSESNFSFSIKDSNVVQLELLFTANFFSYSKRNWGQITNDEQAKTSWFIQEKNLNYAQLLDSIFSNNPSSIYAFEPFYKQYAMLKKYLKKYYYLEKNNSWKVLPDSIPEIKIGVKLPVVALIKEQLFLLDDFQQKDTTSLFNTALEVAVKKFQKRNGIEESGIMTKQTISELKIPIHQRIQQILINMERCKWVPVEQHGDYLIVNIPAFKLYVYHDDLLQWSCNVVVGKSKVTSNTVIFNDNLEYIVFSPYWNVTKNIFVNELLPALKKNKNYLSKLNMEVVDINGNYIATSSIHWKDYNNNFPYIVRQKPGKNNSLGLVKFIFPNSYDIYMHDTPQKNLFNEQIRAFSHGCIRIEKAFELSKFLLRNDKTYTDKKINALMNGGKQTFVKLKAKVPVFIAYFTAWVDKDGLLNFRNDIYNHDAKMKTLLFDKE